MEVFSNQEQLRLFLQSILLGVGIGAVYDLLRAPRRVFRVWMAGDGGVRRIVLAGAAGGTLRI